MNKTIIEARHALLKFFSQESVFVLEEHLLGVPFECGDFKLKRALILEALNDLEKIELIKKLSIEKTWALIKPLAMYEQTVSVGFETAQAISESINAYCDSVGNTKEICDPSNIREKDLRNLVLILEALVAPK